MILVHFFSENSINGDIYQDMLSEWLLLQLEEAVPNLILQQDCAPPHCNINVHEFLNKGLLHHLIGCTGFDMSSLATEITRSNAL